MWKSCVLVLSLYQKYLLKKNGQKYDKNVKRWWQCWQTCGLANLAPLGAAGYKLTATHTQTKRSSDRMSEMLPRLKIFMFQSVCLRMPFYALSMHSRLVLLPDGPLGNVLLAVHDDTEAKKIV